MAPKVIPSFQYSVLHPVVSSPPSNTQERIKRMEILTERINGYIRYMCKEAGQNASSPESVERAVAAFYEELVVLERHLGKIHDNFKLE